MILVLISRGSDPVSCEIETIKEAEARNRL